jgi:hypothetical protein
MNCRTCRRFLRPDEARRTVCRRCEHRMRGWLREIDLQRPLLEASLLLSSAPTEGHSAGRAHSPLPVRPDVISLLATGAAGTVPDPHGDQVGSLPIDTLLQTWAQALAEHVRLRADAPEPESHEATGPRAVPALRPGRTWSTWLTAYLPWALGSPWITAFHSELADLISHIRAITCSEPRRRAQKAPCPSCRAFALFEEDWQTYIDCEACGLLLTPAEYRAHHDTVMPALYRIGVLMTAATAAKETPPA